MTTYEPKLTKTYCGRDYQFYMVSGLRNDGKAFYVRMNNHNLKLEFSEDGGIKHPWYSATPETERVSEWCWMQIQEVEDKYR